MRQDENEGGGGHPYYYSCQCPQGYGYENCTLPSADGADDADGSAGATYCVTGEYTRIAAPTIVEEVSKSFL